MSLVTNQNSSCECSSTPLLTPANDSEAPEVLPVREEGHEDEAVEVKAFHQDPVIICRKEVQEERDCDLTADLQPQPQQQH